MVKEVLNPNTSNKLLNSWKEVSTAKHGVMAGSRGYFVMLNGQLADVSNEMERRPTLASIDHYGYALAMNNRKMFGISDELASRALQSKSDAEKRKAYEEVWQQIAKFIAARVMVMPRSKLTGKPAIFVEIFRQASPKDALRIVQSWVGRQIPDAPDNCTVTVELKGSNISLEADTIHEFLSTNNPRDLVKF